MFSLANAEKVVKPPQNPTARNIRHSLLRKFPFSDKAYKTPIKKHPVIFTAKVPKGKEDEK